MKTRRVYSTTNLAQAQIAMVAAKTAGVGDERLLLVARPDIEIESIPNDRKEADTDFMHGAVRGAGYGAGAGLLAGLLAMAVAPIELTLAGVAAIGAAGAMVGGLGAAMMGASLPDPIRRKFEHEIQEGSILLVVDVEENDQARVERAILEAGGIHLPYESATSMA